MAHLFQFTRGNGSKGTVSVARRPNGGVYLQIDRHLEREKPDEDGIEKSDEPILIMLTRAIAEPVARAILEECEDQ